MVMQGIEFGINDLYTAALHEDFTHIDSGVLTVRPIANPYPRPLIKNETGMQGGYLELRLLDIHPDAHEFCRYWEYLPSTGSDHQWPLATIVRYLLRGQGLRVATGLFCMYPGWVKITERIGLMYYFEDTCDDRATRKGSEFREINKQVERTVNGKIFPGTNGEWFQKGLPELQGKIKSCVTELRFAQ